MVRLVTEGSGRQVRTGKQAEAKKVIHGRIATMWACKASEERSKYFMKIGAVCVCADMFLVEMQVNRCKVVP